MAPLFGKKPDLTPEQVAEFFGQHAADMRTLLAKADAQSKDFASRVAGLERQAKRVDELTKKVAEVETAAATWPDLIKRAEGLGPQINAAEKTAAAAAVKARDVETKLKELDAREAAVKTLGEKLKGLEAAVRTVDEVKIDVKSAEVQSQKTAQAVEAAKQTLAELKAAYAEAKKETDRQASQVGVVAEKFKAADNDAQKRAADVDKTLANLDARAKTLAETSRKVENAAGKTDALVAKLTALDAALPKPKR